jgi:hypothetical protein
MDAYIVLGAAFLTIACALSSSPTFVAPTQLREDFGTRRSRAIHATANLGSALFPLNQGGTIMRTLGKIAATLGVVGAIVASSAVPAAAWHGYHHRYYHHHYYAYHPYYHHRHYWHHWY